MGFVTEQTDWYRKRREQVEDLFVPCRPANELEEDSLSPSGRYRLQVRCYDTATTTGKKTLPYTRGTVYDAATGRVIAEILRNFMSFPKCWVEGRSNGHDYLLCSEDYQGRTVIELDTGRRANFVPEAARVGHGHCVRAYFPSPNGRVLFVLCCIWGAPDELFLFDFSDPLALPYRELGSWPGRGRYGDVIRVHGFADDGSFSFDIEIEYRTTDNQTVNDLTEAEYDSWSEEPSYQATSKEGIITIRWQPDGKVSERRIWE